MMRGRILAVAEEPLGTHLAADLAITDHTMTVDDPYALLGATWVDSVADTGEAMALELGVADTVAGLQAEDLVDMDGRLAVPLTVAPLHRVSMGVAVDVPGASQMVAHVSVSDVAEIAPTSEPMACIVDHRLRPLLEPGIRDGGETCLIEETGLGEWRVRELIDVSARVRTEALAPEMRELPELTALAQQSAADALSRADQAIRAADGMVDTYSLTPPPETPPEGTSDGARWVQWGTVDGVDAVVGEWRLEDGVWVEVPPRTISASLVTSGVIRAGVAIHIGDPTSRHTVLTGTGVAVVDPGVDGPETSTVLGGVDADGNPVDQLVIGGGLAGIDPQGVVVGTGAVIDGDPLFNVAPGGIPAGSMPSLTDVANEAMRSQQAVTQWVSDLAVVRGAGWEAALGDLQYDAVDGARYEARLDSMLSMIEGCEYVDVGFREEYGGTTPKVDSPLMTYRRVENITTDRVTSLSLRHSWTATQTGPHRVLLTIRPNAGAAYLYGRQGWVGEFSIHRSTMRNETGAWTGHDGGVPRIKPADPTPPPVVRDPVAPAPKRRQQTWTSPWYSSWRGGVDTRGSAQFGVWGGVRRYSQFGIPASMALALKGATVHSVKVGVEISHVGYSSPGWLYIGASSYTNRTTRPGNPSGFSGATYRTPLWSSGFRWTTMPASWGPAIGNETIGSVTLGENASTGMADYGHAAVTLKYWADYTK